jgi:hypothetical protein
MVLYHVFIEHYIVGGTEKTSGLFANLTEKLDSCVVKGLLEKIIKTKGTIG